MRSHPLREVHRWLLEVGVRRFSDIIDSIKLVESLPGTPIKVRVIMVDGSFLDIYWSPSGRYSLHYERRHIDGRIYRHDNAPHPSHRHVRTFPKHYHEGDEHHVVESHLPERTYKSGRGVPRSHKGDNKNFSNR